ncbi:hypothetical protein C8Q78DRAFT_1076281 [Trametes maxima]|nr:hypothetical protein C8Q78DRAFT_1076281 [Trametes maxima]
MNPALSTSPQRIAAGLPTGLSFPSPFTFINNSPTPLLEFRLRRFSHAIRQKLRWWEKLDDVNIVARWTREVVDHDRKMVEDLWGGEKRLDAGAGEKQWPRDPITEAQLRYLFDELRHLASQRDEATGIMKTVIPLVYESSSLISPPLKAAIRNVAQALEDVTEDEKDWHPGSNEQVLNLVHPSLFCLRIGKSFVRDLQPEHADPVRRLALKDYIRERPDMQRLASNQWRRGRDEESLPFGFTISGDFQWLPTDFAVSADGHVSPQGYINNLHPEKHASAYQTISSVLQRFIPLFEHVISDELSPPTPAPFSIDPQGWYEHLNDRYPDSQGGDYEEWERIHRWPQLPDAEPFQPPSSEGRVTLDLKGRTLQVIVKLANIVLTPDRPTYPGGSWHVEGMLNERIVATGLYYYDSVNITASRLAFRQAVGDGQYQGATMLNYEQWDHQGYLVVYGLTNTLALNQALGHIVATEDKCVAFPNIYQHRVGSFALADRTRPGHRKILAFFLVDPLTPVRSTSSVPPQQAQWYRDAVYSASAFRKLPAELVEHILNFVLEGTITMEEAKADREELMKERAGFTLNHNNSVFEAEFAMCEH